MSGDLLKSIAIAPVVVRRIVNMIPNNRLDRPFERGQFTVREIVAHIADWEQLYRGRMDRALTRPHTSIVEHDESVRAVEMGYAKSNLHEQLNVFASQRTKTRILLQSLTDAELDKCFVHPIYGPIKIIDQATMMLGYDLYHIEQLTAYLSES